MKINKNKLKECYYWEYTDLYDKLPAKLEVPDYEHEIFPKTMTHKEILETYNIAPYTVEQAFGAALSIIPELQNDWKSKLIYFMNGTTLCRLIMYRGDDGRLGVNVNRVDLGREWHAGNGTLFSKSFIPSETSPLETSTLKHFCPHCEKKLVITIK